VREPTSAGRWMGRDARPPPPSRTKWTRRVPHPVLIGHAASLTPSDLKGEGAGHYLFEAARRGVWVAFVEPVVRLSTSDAPHQHQTPTPDDVILSQQRVRLSLIAAACSIISHRSSVFDYLSSQQRVRLSLIAAARCTRDEGGFEDGFEGASPPASAARPRRCGACGTAATAPPA
jgi:hypothetical protein